MGVAKVMVMLLVTVLLTAQTPERGGYWASFRLMPAVDAGAGEGRVVGESLEISNRDLSFERAQREQEGNEYQQFHA
jgi:hypothetical protein